MKYLLAAINAKYIHSNLGIYSLKKYAEEKLSDPPQIELGEYTINHQMDRILQDIYRRSPDVAGFSCYIWNILYVKELVRNLKKVMPKLRIWLGGPEVSYDAVRVLKELPEVELVMLGEGEETFRRLLELSEQELAERMPSEEENNPRNARREEALYQLPGIAFRDEDGNIIQTVPAPLLSLDEIPFSYGDLKGLEHRIIYYESSRGCPFSCSYCLSSIDKSVRFRDIGLVKQELDFFLERRVPQVKFVDRTFNCKKSHAMAIWQHILEHDNGVTNFHFEIAADLLDEEELHLLEQMRPGLIQLEIGVQSTNPDTICEIKRKMDLAKLKQVVERINRGHNIHQHLDLIAGLPHEDYSSFCTSFNAVYEMRPEQLQLGFLKVLKGSYMHERAQEYGLVYRELPPYEVLSTRWLSYADVLKLKGIEDMVEVYYNSGQFTQTLKQLESQFSDAFSMYENLARYYDRKQLTGLNHSRIARYEILHQFIKEELPLVDIGRMEDCMMVDLYLRENVKSRPSFALDQSPYKEQIRSRIPDLRTLGTQVHGEVLRSGELVIFDYRERDLLTRNAKVTIEGRELQHSGGTYGKT